jgi:hypothetical protein
VTESILQALGLPQPFGATLLALALILALAPYLGGADFGLLKVPTFSPDTQRGLRVIGPVALAAAVGLHVPFLSTADPPLSTAATSLAWVRSEDSPLAGGAGGDIHARTCPLNSAVIGFRATTGEAAGADPGIDWIWDLQFICTPVTLEQVSPMRYELRTGEATTLTDRIGGGGGSRDSGLVQCPPNEVVTAFDAESRSRGFGDAEYLNYLVVRCASASLVSVDGKWNVEIVTARNLTPIGKAQLGGKRTAFSCADGRTGDDGIVTRIRAQAGALVDGVGIGCSRAVVNITH